MGTDKISFGPGGAKGDGNAPAEAPKPVEGVAETPAEADAEAPAEPEAEAADDTGEAENK
jgi:hypothetical protein